MISKPDQNDYKLISRYVGRILCGISFLQIIPLATALAFKEWAAALDFVIGFNACFLSGVVFLLLGRGAAGSLRWLHSMTIAAVSWILATLLCAVPYQLSGHYGSYLDSVFDVMSGFTTTGLVLIVDLDHVSNGLNMWRHLLTYVGGQGMIVLVLSFLVKGTAGAYMMYVGEGKEERLLPNVIQTSRAIWYISIAYLFLGTAALFVTLTLEGLAFPRSLLQAVWLFMGAWSTGGFAPQSQSILYYHSLAVEIVTLFIFVLGSFNFILHYAVWSGHPKEIVKNIEIRSFSLTVAIAFAILIFALIPSHLYGDPFILLRRAAYTLLSAHTTTGNMTVYATQIKAWGSLAMIAVIMAMAIGGSACSTAGGIKGLRVGIVARGLYQEIKRIVLTENSVLMTKFHHIKDIVLTDQHVKMAGLIVILYLLLYCGGGVLGIVYGYPGVDAVFESTSAGSNTGLSCGITAPSMPTGLKVYYLFAMWAGRLEFISLFGLLAFGVSALRGK